MRSWGWIAVVVMASCGSPETAPAGAQPVPNKPAIAAPPPPPEGGYMPPLIASPLVTFFDAPYVEDLAKLDANVAFLGVPFDHGGWDQSGQRFAPRAIRNESVYFAGSDGVYDFARRGWIWKGVKAADLGDVRLLPADFGTNFDRISAAVRDVLRRKPRLLVAVGGDHSASFPVIRGFDVLGTSIHVIHFDSHLDFSDGVPDARFSHASPMRRASELTFVHGITSIGTRGVLAHDRWVKDVERLGANVFTNVTAEEAMKLGAAATIAKIPKADAYYVSFDVDVLDPAVAPACGTPEPGGFDFYFMRALFAELAKQKRVVVGFDVMEHLPAKDDGSHRSAHLVARLVLDFIAELDAQGRFR